MEWKGDNVDIDHVFRLLRDLIYQRKNIADEWVPKTSIETRVLNRMKSLLTECEQENKDTLRSFVLRTVTFATVPDFVYPYPVN